MGSNDETSYYGEYGAFTPGVQSTAKFANTPAAPTKLTTSSTYTTSVQLTRPTIKGGSSSSEKSTCTGTASILTSSTAAARSPTSSISSAEPAHTNAPAKFAQMVDRKDPMLYEVTEAQLLKTPFGDICPSGNCVDDCKNTTRVFQAIPQGLQVDPLRYGRMEAQMANVTLFSTCSNLEVSTNFATAEENVNFTPYFSTNDSTDLFKVAASIASCFAATCEQTRKPTLCADACSPAKLLSSPTTFDYMLGLPNCVVRLCDNTCSLPYVDPDVLGIGVLISYFFQALLLVICATAIMASAGFQLWKVSQAQPTVRESLRSPLETFVRVQALFGISLATATLIMRPDEIDPLNGYALILTSIMGFLPPVFTLMLLHSHGFVRKYQDCTIPMDMDHAGATSADHQTPCRYYTKEKRHSGSVTAYQAPRSSSEQATFRISCISEETAVHVLHTIFGDKSILLMPSVSIPVALLFWVPPFLDVLRSMYEKEKYEKVQNAHESQS
ncbi:hypothetical protein CSIM01_01235 [Colletotrichum simmondsii]|uniref:Uncharacterized protein n=1 Tax=Colletotrichum simmondsii TaxID=703756 RepID=A0A135TAJ4_9PEZI|nr:hypothetical protein CSIM01_01235 [Colletotrichum simmondsii]